MKKLLSMLVLFALVILAMGAQQPEQLELTEAQSARIKAAHFEWVSTVQQAEMLARQVMELRNRTSSTPGEEGDLWLARIKALEAICAELTAGGTEVGIEDLTDNPISADFRHLNVKGPSQ